MGVVHDLLNMLKPLEVDDVRTFSSDSEFPKIFMLQIPEYQAPVCSSEYTEEPVPAWYTCIDAHTSRSIRIL